MLGSLHGSVDATTGFGDSDDSNVHALIADALVSNALVSDALLSDAIVSHAGMASRAVDITRGVGDFDVMDPRFWMGTFSAQVMQIQFVSALHQARIIKCIHA